MITVLENSLTKKKHTLNLVDHKGRVFGFNPYPKNRKISWELCIGNSQTPILSNKEIAIEKYIVGAPFHFGSDVVFSLDGEGGQPDGMRIELVSDDLSIVNHLFVYGDGGEYYCDDIGFSDEDIAKLFSKEEIAKWKNGRWAEHYKEYFSQKTWDTMTLAEKLDYLYKKIEKLENKVNLLGNAR